MNHHRMHHCSTISLDLIKNQRYLDVSIKNKKYNFKSPTKNNTHTHTKKRKKEKQEQPNHIHVFCLILEFPREKDLITVY